MAVRRLRCHSQRDSCDPSGRQTRADLSACSCACPDEVHPCRCPATAAGRHSSGRISSSCGLAPGGQAWHAPVAELASGAAMEPAAPAGSGARLAGWIYSCGGAGGAGVLATAPDRCQVRAPARAGAASILWSCVYFLVLCNIVHQTQAQPCHECVWPFSFSYLENVVTFAGFAINLMIASSCNRLERKRGNQIRNASMGDPAVTA